MTRASDLARLIGAGATINDGTTITTADNDPQLILKSTDADGDRGPVVQFTRDSASPADDDILGRVQFLFDNDAGEVTTAVQIEAAATDVSNGTEDASLNIVTMQSGATSSRMKVNSAETVFNDDSKDVDFRVESDGNGNMLVVDAGNNGVAIGGGVTSGYQLQINNASGSVQQLLSAATNFNSTIAFGDQDANTSGEIIYAHNGDSMRLHTNASERVRITSAGTLLIGKTSTANSAGAGDIQGAAAGAVNYELRSDSAGIQFGTTSNHYLAFRTNNAEEMRIDATGHLMLNTTSERNSGNLSIDFDGSSQGAQGLNDTTSGNGSVFIGFLTGGTFRGSITNNNNSAVAFNQTSDYRLKESVKYDWEATTRLKKLKPVRFNFIADKDNTVEGFLAHEAQEVVPQAITGTKDETKTTKNVVLDKDENIIGTDITEDEWKTKKEDGTYSDDTSWKASITQKHYQQIDHSKLVPLLTKTILELEARITALESK